MHGTGRTRDPPQPARSTPPPRARDTGVRDPEGDGYRAGGDPTGDTRSQDGRWYFVFGKALMFRHYAFDPG